MTPTKSQLEALLLAVKQVAEKEDIRTREYDVLTLLIEGASNGQIAEKLGMKLRTVKAYMAREFSRRKITGGLKRVKLAIQVVKERNAASAR